MWIKHIDMKYPLRDLQEELDELECGPMNEMFAVTDLNFYGRKVNIVDLWTSVEKRCSTQNKQLQVCAYRFTQEAVAGGKLISHMYAFIVLVSDYNA